MSREKHPHHIWLSEWSKGRGLEADGEDRAAYLRTHGIELVTPQKTLHFQKTLFLGDLFFL